MLMKNTERLWKMKLHNIIFAKINDGWKASWIEGDSISYRNLYWYEWPYLFFLRIRDFITFRKGDV